MPIANFHGQTFVAFTDIADFKAMMRDGNRPRLALKGAQAALVASGLCRWAGGPAFFSCPLHETPP